MKVKELIQELQKFPQDMEVNVTDRNMINGISIYSLYTSPEESYLPSTTASAFDLTILLDGEFSEVI